MTVKRGKFPNKDMAKIQNISEIHSTLGFTEFDILEKYRKSFNESELGWLHSVFPFECMAKQLLYVWGLLGICTWIMPDILLASDAVNDIIQGINYFQAFSFGIGQVMFQGNIWTGLLFLVGILVNSRTAAFYTVIGAFLPILLAVLPGIDAETLNMGLMGYNGVLCAIALGNRTLKSLVWVSCSVLLSVILQIIGMNLEITTLTAPFVVSVWVIMGIQKLVNPKTAKC